jgi:hypothetical protein
LTEGKGQGIWNTKQEQGQGQEGRTNDTESKGQGQVHDKTRQDRPRNPAGRVGLVEGVRGKSKSQVAPHHPRPRRVPERRALQALSLQPAPASWSDWPWKPRRSGTPRGEANKKKRGCLLQDSVSRVYRSTAAAFCAEESIVFPHMAVVALRATASQSASAVRF